ncbi:hypothetical protein [Candidatus Pelagibacter sp. HIMB1506]|uniref:hypothetical protein n=1 Tax=Candidatus Pelagibacter sp. HIMB1506 TaxID=3413337 RepID=UPI003F856D21
MFNFSSKPIVAYVAYEPFGIEYLNRFLDKYNQFSSGLDHDLLICFKQFRDKNLIEDWKKKISNPFIEFDDSNQPNDFDIGSYIRIAKAFPERYTLFLDTHTRPNSDNWLKIFANHYKPKSILGATASYSSLSSQFLNLYYKQHTIFQQIRWGLNHLINVQLFPNPHIRTTAFFILAKDLVDLNFDISGFTKKIATNYFEGGRKGLSNKLKKNGFELLLVNSDNNVFSVSQWPKSETYCLDNQDKLLFIDNRTEEYKNSDELTKKKMAKFTWG